jgi:hypothetical protein
MVKSPKKRSKLTDLLDAIEVRDVEDFTDTHKLKKALYKG